MFCLLPLGESNMGNFYEESLCLKASQHSCAVSLEMCCMVINCSN